MITVSYSDFFLLTTAHVIGAASHYLELRSEDCGYDVQITDEISIRQTRSNLYGYSNNTISHAQMSTLIVIVEEKVDHCDCPLHNCASFVYFYALK